MYKYEVLGGLQAKSQLAQEVQDSDMYKVVNAEVYVGSDRRVLTSCSKT